MTQFPVTVRNVAIVIPDKTSRTIYEPEYVVPLIEGLWGGALRDPTQPIKAKKLDPKNPYEKTLLTTTVHSIEEEKARLRTKYGIHPRTKAPLFDAIYPGLEFERAFERVVEHSGAAAPSSTEEVATADEQAQYAREAALASLQRISRVGGELAGALFMRGFKSVKEVADADPAQIEPIPGVGRVTAQRIVQAAFELHYGPAETVGPGPSPAADAEDAAELEPEVDSGLDTDEEDRYASTMQNLGEGSEAD